MAVAEYILKNFFSTVTANYKFFYKEDDGYEWSTCRIDGESYTCMKYENKIRIFQGTVHYKCFNEGLILTEFEL